MQKKSRLHVNLIYNVSYQLLSILLPLITSPYITRVLGAGPLGLYSKSHSVANYFFLFALLGVNNYGNRAIARVRDDKSVTNRSFWEIYIFQALMSFLMSAGYILYCFLFTGSERYIYLLQFFYVFSGLFDVNWFCYGMEQFKLTTIRSTVIRLAILAGVFLFVHDASDLPAYTFILSMSFLLSALAIWPYVLRNTRFVRPTWAGIRKHILPNLKLFWPVIAVSLYNIMDKILLGAFSTNEEVAFYANAEQIVTLPTLLLLALDNVVMPRISNSLARNETEKAQTLMNQVMMLAMLFSSGMAFGIAAISDVFAPWFYGQAFTRCGYFILLLSPTILFRGWAAALRTQFIIPTGRDRIYIISLSAGAAVNLVLDIALIPGLAGVGAIIGTIAAEFSVAFIQFFMCRKDIPLKTYLKNGCAFILIGLIMYVCVVSFKSLSWHPVPTLLMQVFAGVLLYMILACAYMIKIAREPALVNEGLKILRIRKRF